MIVTPCGALPNDCDCSYCLKMAECKEARAAICRGCVREHKEMCSRRFRQGRIEEGYCRGRELRE